MHAEKNSLRYLLSLTPGSLVISGNLIGGWWSLSATIYTMVLLIAIEHIIKEDKREINIQSAAVPNLILFLHVLLQSASIVSLCFGIYTGILSAKFIVFATLSTGIGSGIEGINAAHELIHRRNRMAQLAGIWNLLLVNYAHFFIEHIKNHHKWVGTKQDPATACVNETVYGFFGRTVPQQYKSALYIEASRLRKKGDRPYGLNNFVTRISILEILMTAAIFYFLGTAVAAAYIFQSFIAVFLLEYVNYIEHYGLLRADNEKVNPLHSWQSNLPVSRFALIELSRHADHHIMASKPFYTLKSYRESPTLPSGYFGMFYYALIPRLWFKTVHPVLEKHFPLSPGSE